MAAPFRDEKTIDFIFKKIQAMKKPIPFLIFNDIVRIQQRQPFADEFCLFRNFIQFLLCHFALLLEAAERRQRRFI